LAQCAARDVVRRGDQEKEHEEKQQDAEHGHDSVDQTPEQVGDDHRSLFHTVRTAGAQMTTTIPSSAHAGHLTGLFHSRRLRARSATSTSRYFRVENDMPSGFALCTQPWMRAYDSGWKSSTHGRSRSRMPRISWMRRNRSGPSGAARMARKRRADARLAEVGAVRAPPLPARSLHSRNRKFSGSG